MTAVRIVQFKAPDGSVVLEAARAQMVRERRKHKEGTAEYTKLDDAINALVPVLPGELPSSPTPVTEQIKLAEYAKEVFFEDETGNNPYDGTYWLPVRVYPEPFQPEIRVKTSVSASM